MRAWLENNIPIRNEQFGFQKYMGTLDAVYALHNGVAADIGIGLTVITAFIDFS